MAADYEDGTVQPENGRQQAGRRRGGSTGQDRVGLLLVIGLIILAVILIFAIYQSRRVSSSYTVTNEIGGNVYGSDSYEVMGSNIIRYSRDGITLINSDGDALWNQTFGMADPIISVGSTYIAIGDRGASSLYIFDQSGEVSEITTDVPLAALCISDQGVTAAILSDSDNNYINLYEKDGTILATIKASFADMGYPIALDISPDSRYLAVSYLNSDEKADVVTNLVFYDFDRSGDPTADSFSLDGICPQIDYLSNTRAAVFTENGMRTYGMGSTISEGKTLEFDDEIRSIFCEDGRIGFIFKNNDGDGAYRMEIYDTGGSKNAEVRFDLDYSRIRVGNGSIVLSDSSNALIYNYSGNLVFDGEIQNGIYDLLRARATDTYWLANTDGLSLISIR